ncbi:hypothetical protein GCM10010517_74230 [Streptosporangium fragile]|uniref:Uncharacterized protein n=1 Tax=Streptosporangium fragile TaxID=46186 RepID=A0ABP6ISB2_9ACTN
MTGAPRSLTEMRALKCTAQPSSSARTFRTRTYGLALAPASARVLRADRVPGSDRAYDPDAPASERACDPDASSPDRAPGAACAPGADRALAGVARAPPNSATSVSTGTNARAGPSLRSRFTFPSHGSSEREAPSQAGAEARPSTLSEFLCRLRACRPGPLPRLLENHEIPRTKSLKICRAPLNVIMGW